MKIPAADLKLLQTFEKHPTKLRITQVDRLMRAGLLDVNSRVNITEIGYKVLRDAIPDFCKIHIPTIVCFIDGKRACVTCVAGNRERMHLVDKRKYDHYLFWFSHKGTGREYICVALFKGEDPSDAAERWAYRNFPLSAVEEGRHGWKRITLRQRKAILKDFDGACGKYYKVKDKKDILAAQLNPRRV